MAATVGAAARRRLLRDLAEVQREPSELVSALPSDHNIFEWHANLRPSSGPLEGVVLHVRITFPQNYPDSPPNMLFPMDELPSFVHPNLYPFGLCLDILSSYVGCRDKHAGWSPAYSVRTLLLQLQSFLFEFDAAPQDHGGHYSARSRYDDARVARVRREAARLRCSCGHCGRRPWPPLAPGRQEAAAAATPEAASAEPSEAMPETPLAATLREVGLARSEAHAALRAISEMERRATGALTAGRTPTQMLGNGASASMRARVEAMSPGGYARLGFATPLGSGFVGWDARGFLVLPQRAKARKLAMPLVAAGDTMEVEARGGSVRFLHNGRVVDAAAPVATLLWDLLAGQTPQPVLLLQHASAEILPGDGAAVARAEAEVQRLEEKERALAEQVQAEERAAALREQERKAAESMRALEEARAAEERRAAEAWARVLAPPRAMPTAGSRKQQWLRLELADLAKPLHEGSANSPWALMRPPLLMSAFVRLEASDVAPLARTCRVWRRLCVRSSLMERVQLCCFYTKASADEDVLGFGVRAEYHEDGNLKSVSTELDALSATAFYRHGLRRGVWGDEFSHFLPLVLNAEHGRRAMPDLERALAALACKQEAASTSCSRFEPWMALAVIPQLMNSFVVALMKEGGDGAKGGVVPRHASERALLGYCSFHHMLLALGRQHPQIVQVANDKLRRFLAGERSKSSVPDLGQLIVYLAVSDAVSWQRVGAAVAEESHVRGALWLLRAQPRLGGDVGDRALLAGALQERLTSARLLMFQAYFIRCLARPSGESLGQSLDRYNRQFGLPTAPQKEMLVLATRDILAVRSWPDVYRRLGLPAPAPDVLAEELREAMNRSAELGYHNPAVLGPFGRFARRPRGGVAPVEKVGIQGSLQRAFGDCRASGAGAAEQPWALAKPAARALTVPEEAEARKCEKLLREITKLEQRAANGEALDTLQLRKMNRKKELLESAVMEKLRAGYKRAA